MITKKSIYGIAVIALVSLFFQNCSQVAFTPDPESEVGNSVGEGISTPDPDSDSNSDGIDTEIPVDQGSLKYPVLKMEARPCVAGALCEVVVSAQEAVQKDVSAKWKTNDTAWTSDPNYARPDQHYVPGSGTFTIKAGQISTVIKVQSKNWENNTGTLMTLSIPVTVRDCLYGQTATSCSVFFK